MERIRAGVIADVVRHAREAAPAECCGLLLGGDGEIGEAVRTRNASGDPSRFVIDPADHIARRREARNRGLAVLGFYHSHPRSAAVPSATDRAEAAYPGHLYLIVGLASDPPDLGLYQFDAGNFRQVRFVTLD
ncbi:MAG: M67 family metallopeptidase [Acidobacteria bacterium]|nr:M67 family metallopeptidase [Acidobacteriota bacterium]